MGGILGDKMQQERRRRRRRRLRWKRRRGGGEGGEEKRVRWRRLECPRTTNDADTTGLPFTAYLLVVSLRDCIFNVPGRALYISSIPLRSLLHLVAFAGSKMNRLTAMRARNFDTLRTSINLIISRHLLSIYKEET